jgi:hypothetical protein
MIKAVMLFYKIFSQVTLKVPVEVVLFLLTQRSGCRLNLLGFRVVFWCIVRQFPCLLQQVDWLLAVRKVQHWNCQPSV